VVAPCGLKDQRGLTVDLASIKLRDEQNRPPKAFTRSAHFWSILEITYVSTMKIGNGSY
jgi:hypothetical protein